MGNALGDDSHWFGLPTLRWPECVRASYLVAHRQFELCRTPCDERSLDHEQNLRKLDLLKEMLLYFHFFWQEYIIV